MFTIRGACRVLSFLSFFGLEDPSQSLDSADGEHPINHLGPKKLLRTGGQGVKAHRTHTTLRPACGKSIQPKLCMWHRSMNEGLIVKTFKNKKIEPGVSLRAAGGAPTIFQNQNDRFWYQNLQFFPVSVFPDCYGQGERRSKDFRVLQQQRKKGKKKRKRVKGRWVADKCSAVREVKVWLDPDRHTHSL